MTVNTYSGIIASLQTWLEKTETNFNTAREDMVALAELRVQRDLDLETLKNTATGTLTASSRVLALPSDHIKPDSLQLTVSGSLVALKRRTKGFCDKYAPAVATESQPLYWAVDDVDNLYLVPTPDTTYAYTMRYLARIDPLVLTSNETNWLTDNVYDLLFAATMYEATVFLNDTAMQTEQLEKYINLLIPAQMQYLGETRIRYQRIKARPSFEEKV